METGGNMGKSIKKNMGKLGNIYIYVYIYAYIYIYVYIYMYIYIMYIYILGKSMETGPFSSMICLQKIGIHIFHSKLLNCQGVKQKQLGQSMDFVGVVVKMSGRVTQFINES
jgi:hypothetical protein